MNDAELPLKVLLKKIPTQLPNKQALKMPPPSVSELPLRVLLMTSSVPCPPRPSLKIPPPFRAELRLRVQLTMATVAVPLLRASLARPPPPDVAELPLRVQLLTVNIAWSLKMPPPRFPGSEGTNAAPLVMVRPAMVTVMPEPTWNTRLAA